MMKQKSLAEPVSPKYMYHFFLISLSFVGHVIFLMGIVSYYMGCKIFMGNFTQRLQ